MYIHLQKFIKNGTLPSLTLLDFLYRINKIKRYKNIFNKSSFIKSDKLKIIKKTIFVIATQ